MDPMISKVLADTFAGAPPRPGPSARRRPQPAPRLRRDLAGRMRRWADRLDATAPQPAPCA